ncbi:MAG: N-acetylmuramoyl-L-alanine amidase [Nitrospiria bacterium]
MNDSRQHLYIFSPLIFILFFLIGIPSFDSQKAPSIAHAENKKQSTPLTVVKNIRYSNRQGGMRVVVDLSQSVSYEIARRRPSQTVVIQLAKAKLGKHLKKDLIQKIEGDLLKKIKITQRNKETVDVSLNYKHLGEHKTLVLKEPDRIVIDLLPPAASPPPPFEIHTIVIDPGHGGKDPGATGRSGLHEKEIVLDVSMRLKKLIEKKLKKKVIMTRDEDVFISLKERTRIANSSGADLFISVHVNSSRSRRLKGIEVYLLGRASSKRALATAARENATSHGAAIDFQKMILNDLEREFTQNASLELAHFTNGAIVENLISKYPTTALGVKKAPFFVLSHTEMPAILAEISFLSNRMEEKRLRSKRYRQKAAESLYKGVKAYINSLSAG